MKTIVDTVHDAVNVVLIGAVAVAVIASALVLWNGPTPQPVLGTGTSMRHVRGVLVVDE